jgi:mono/diheme cytochrome c family protein
VSKKTFVVFGLVVIFLAVLIPWLVFRSDGDAARGAQKVPSDLKEGQALFQINCGNCHTLYAAGTDGNFAPNLDELLAPSGPPEGEGAQTTIDATKKRVLNAIDHGVDSSTTPGRMPPGILNGEQAEEVAEFVAATAGEG